ncbi:Tigger transposable element-derived protein 6 [Mytilus coruscus]|uniref:Tigger transposable element-derived protein 6 n=1 Tax=Mytilus coruscus TaxID=42192 RepID=A0A6J8D762_MYTCO|nr:Tigger transposable element-derived protein 6 [Mytilus coruscus]
MDGYKVGVYDTVLDFCGESADVNLNVVAEFKSELPEIVNDYDPRDTFNADETGLFFRALPDKTLADRGKDCKGGKKSKQRLTVMLCCSVRGEKLKPLVIGNANKPRCFRNLDVKSLPVTWKANKKSWMHNTFFTEWAKDINRDMRIKSRKIVIFLDNATSHWHNLKLSNVELKFFPAKTTSKLQPLDLGITVPVT